MVEILYFNRYLRAKLLLCKKGAIFTKPNPLFDFIRYHCRFFSGRIRFPEDLNGKPASEHLEHTFRTFLNVLHMKEIDIDMRKVGAILKVTFKVRKMSFLQKKVIPLLSIPFFAGVPGFVSKSFMINESDNTFRGFYKWESVEAAQAYITSYPMGFMKKISIPGSVHYEILPVNNLK